MTKGVFALITALSTCRRQARWDHRGPVREGRVTTRVLESGL
jgi:hypothetical protein